ncbi:perlucin-like protein isoform X2 [Ruditapes philippinarum]|uniref:perlucin-like protein isoform X2 n=1 Tax=Ruditapes philippinarum TaxID=129788 RepID=UPI00295AB3A7|nr:perlucin-like protein isoform X2 [Ruditapes philippinarum]
MDVLLAFFYLQLTIGFVSGTYCTDGFEVHRGSCYFFSHGKEAWEDAHQSCKLFGAMLVEVDSWDEQNYISEKARILGDYFWIGLTDKLIEGEYMWTTSQQLVTFSNWGPGEPNGHDHENCVLIDSPNDYRWADVRCDRPEHYICEKSGGGSIVG